MKHQLPSFSSLVGVRSQNGVEFATGPNLSASGLAFVFALGYNYTKGDLNLPINIAFVPNKQGPRNSPLGDALNATTYFDSVRMRENGCKTDDFRGLQFEFKELSPRRGFFQT